MKRKIQIDEAEVYEAPEPWKRTLSIVVDKQIAGAENVVLGLGEFQPNQKCAPHAHEESEEIYWILKGSGFVTVGSEKYEVKPDVALFVPKKTLHQIGCVGDEPLVFVWVMAPPGNVPESIRQFKRIR